MPERLRFGVEFSTFAHIFSTEDCGDCGMELSAYGAGLDLLFRWPISSLKQVENCARVARSGRLVLVAKVRVCIAAGRHRLVERCGDRNEGVAGVGRLSKPEIGETWVVHRVVDDHRPQMRRELANVILIPCVVFEFYGVSQVRRKRTNRIRASSASWRPSAGSGTRMVPRRLFSERTGLQNLSAVAGLAVTAAVNFTANLNVAGVTSAQRRSCSTLGKRRPVAFSSTDGSCAE